MRAMFLVVVGALMALALGGVALADQGAGKAPLYGPYAGGYTCAAGGAATSETFGFVVLNTNDAGMTIANVVVKGGVPLITYDIYVNQDPGGCPTVPSGSLTTNRQGNGTANVKVPTVVGAASFWVSAYDNAGSLFRSPAVQVG